MGNDRGGRTTVAPAVLRAWREGQALSGAEAANADTAVIEMGGTVATRGIARVTPGLFAMLGNVRALRGRLFDPSEGRAGHADRVLLSEDVWRGLYHADPAIVGRRVTIDGESLTVVGILPSDFRFPSSDTVLWRPIDVDAPPPERASEQPQAYVRFALGVPRPEALRILTEAARAADGANANLRPWVRPHVEIS